MASVEAMIQKCIALHPKIFSLCCDLLYVQRDFERLHELTEAYRTKYGSYADRCNEIVNVLIPNLANIIAEYTCDDVPVYTCSVFEPTKFNDLFYRNCVEFESLDFDEIYNLVEYYSCHSRLVYNPIPTICNQKLIFDRLRLSICLNISFLTLFSSENAYSDEGTLFNIIYNERTMTQQYDVYASAIRNCSMEFIMNVIYNVNKIDKLTSNYDKFRMSAPISALHHIANQENKKWMEPYLDCHIGRCPGVYGIFKIPMKLTEHTPVTLSQIAVLFSVHTPLIELNRTEEHQKITVAYEKLIKAL